MFTLKILKIHKLTKIPYKGKLLRHLQLQLKLVKIHRNFFNLTQ